MSLTLKQSPRHTEFRFDPGNHEYWYDERRIVSVTEAIGDLIDYSRAPPEAVEYKRQIGKALDTCIVLGDSLDPETVDPAVLPYFNGYRQFCLDTGFVMLETQCPRYHFKYDYAGTHDQIGIMKKELVLLDTKCVAVYHPATALQTSSYAELWDQHQHRRDKIQHRFALVLKPDARYELIEHTDRTDLHVFLSCLNRYLWRIKHGLTSRTI